jgi:hypothetical protein
MDEKETDMADLPRITNVGTIDIQRDPESGDIEVFWPGWVIEWDDPAARRVGDDDGVGYDATKGTLGGQTLMLGVGGGAAPHLRLSNSNGNAEAALATIRVGVKSDGSGGYTMADLARIAAQA